MTRSGISKPRSSNLASRLINWLLKSDVNDHADPRMTFVDDYQNFNNWDYFHPFVPLTGSGAVNQDNL
jgi:hypothetical protein